MPKVRPIDTIARKWQENASAAAGRYEEGVRDPLNDWATNTRAAASAWQAGVQGAIARGAFAAGVSRAGTAKWQAKALAKGPRRFSEGVSVSAEDYRSGFEPYRAVIEGTTLPARGPKGDPRNIERVAAIARALHEAKLRRGGGRS